MLRHCIQSRHIPDLDRVITASRKQAQAVGGGCERQAGDEALMAAGVADYLPGLPVPDLNGAVLTGRCDPSAFGIGAEGEGVDVSTVPPKGLQLLAGLHVPDLDGVVLTARRQEPTIRTERQVRARPVDPSPEAKAGLLL